MVTSLLLLLFQIDVKNLDALAQRRNVAELRKMLVEGSSNPFAVLASNGAYETGKFGWRAVGGQTPNGEASFVVFTTPLTSEDIGELVFQQESDRLRYLPETDSLGYRVVRHDLDVRFFPTEKRAAITDNLTIAKTGQAKPYFLFRMSPSYRVSSVQEEGKPVPFTQLGGVVFLPSPATAQTTYKIEYEASPSLRLYAGSIDEREASLTNDYWYPMIARQPAPYSIKVSAPSDWTVVAQGEPVSVEKQGDKVVAQYRMDLPVVYYSLSAGPYRTMYRDINGKRYTVWGPSLTEAQMQDQISLSAPIVEFYEKTFGYWPFARFGMLHSPAYGFGALEAYSFATYGFGFPTEDAHEPAHTLFGGVLNNSYLKSFWNESFAVFCEGLYSREAPFGSVAERRQAFVQTPEVSQEYNLVALDDAGAHIGSAASTLGYGKGGFVLQMLEQLVGTESLIRAISRWIKERPTHRTVEWADFEKIMVAEAPNSPIKRFFDDWVGRPGYAVFDVKDIAMDGEDLRFAVEFRGRSYTLPLEVHVMADGGRSEVLKTVVTGNSRRTEVRLRPSFRPKLVSVDPFRRLVRPIEDDERPVELSAVVSRMKSYVDPSHKEYLRGVDRARGISSLPEDLDGIFIIGHPDSVPAMKPLLAKVGLVVDGDRLTFDGTSIDLKTGGALAIVDLGDGKSCAVGIGNVRLEPRLGRARLAVFDDLGRVLRARTDPKTTGALTFRL